jgi:HSP20 family protein
MRKLPSLWAQPGGDLDFSRDPFGALRDRMNQLFGDFGQNFPAGWLDQNDRFVLAPNIDVVESENEAVITAELPGVDRDDVDLSFENDTLILSGEKKAEKTEEDKDKKYRLVERSYGSFRRAIPLPFKADADAIKAAFDNGVLTVTVPKSKDASQGASRIAIESPPK